MEKNDGYQEFDRKVKNLLADAAEPAPEGAWEAIAARLAAGAGGTGAGAGVTGSGAGVTGSGTGAGAGSGAGAGAARRVVFRPWMRRTGYAVTAVAAALLLFILLQDQAGETGPAEREQTQALARADEQPDTPLARADEQLEPAMPAQALEGTKPAEPARPEKSAKTSETAKTAESTQTARPAQRTETQALAQAVEKTAPAMPVPASPAGTDTETSVGVSPEETAAIASSPEQATSVVVPAAQISDTTAIAQMEPGSIPLNWDDLDEEPESKPLKKHQPNGFHLAAYSNALSNFTGNKSSLPIRQSGAQGSNLPDHSYFSEKGESNYSIPLTVGLNFTYDLLSHLSIGVGINYTRLSRHFSGTYYQLQNDGTFDIGTDYDKVYNIQQFLGIPVTVYFHILRTKHINLYVHAGGMVEKCLANTWTADNRAINYNEPVKGVQWSAGAGLGVDFMLASFVSLYLDPDIKYYFAHNQPKSIRTRQPWMLGFELGVRFHL